MRALLQRVSNASVTVNKAVIGEIDKGLLILLGISTQDSQTEAIKLANKIIKLRIFSDDAGKMNLSVKDINGSALVVSQFTLYADAKKGNRPSYINAARPEQAIPLYEFFSEQLRQAGLSVANGEFGADMNVNLLNQGPVSIWLDSDEL